MTKLTVEPQTLPSIPKDGKIIFVTGAPSFIEVLRFEPNGDCYVRGELVESNPKVWEAFREWLASTGQLDFKR